MEHNLLLSDEADKDEQSPTKTAPEKDHSEIT